MKTPPDWKKKIEEERNRLEKKINEERERERIGWIAYGSITRWDSATMMISTCDPDRLDEYEDTAIEEIQKMKPIVKSLWTEPDRLNQSICDAVDLTKSLTKERKKYLDLSTEDGTCPICLGATSAVQGREYQVCCGNCYKERTAIIRRLGGREGLNFVEFISY